MDRNELTLLIAGALVAAFLLGWIFRWFFGRMNAVGPRNARRTADMAAKLHAAEQARHDAEARAEHVESEARRHFASMEAELSSTRAALDSARAQAEEIREAYRQATGGAVRE
jgi:hypothetical protein